MFPKPLYSLIQFQSMYTFKAKLWIEKDNEFIMSSGRALVLRLIKEKCSLNAVAKEMKMSYRHLWGIVKKINKKAKEELIKTDGRRTILTAKGKRLLREFEMRSKELENFLKYGKKPMIAVDGIIVMNEKIVLVKRKNPPFENCFALPGGFVEYGEKTENAILREIKEETNLNCKVKKILGVYSDKERDPRWHVISIVYELEVLNGKIKAKDDAKEVKFFPLNKLPELAFDHEKILKDYLKN